MEEHNRPPVPSFASTAAPTPLRTGSPSSLRNPFEPSSNPFATPGMSRPASSFGSSSVLNRFEERAGRYFHSRRIRGEVEKPWLAKKDPKEKWVTILPILGIIVGLGISGFLVWDGIRSVVKNNYCLVLEDDFSSGINTDVWNYEIETGGFGNQQFEMTTDSRDNVFVDSEGNLNIKVTTQDPELMERDNIINLLKDGSCTSNKFENCVVATNTTAGNSSVINPAISGRLNTKGRRSIKYGRVEVVAQMPEGDWLWPAIWLMPERETYGIWPASGEIDVAESRGNNYTYEQGGNNIVSSALHWGPNSANDGWWRTNNKFQALHTTYGADFNTFGLEWNEKYLFTYINSRLLQVLYTNFDEKSLWERGNFPASGGNGTFLRDPWSSGGQNAPFDQAFYLILNVAVGGRNGWFEDSKNGKPWLDSSENARKDFWTARDRWMPTWTQPQMKVNKVTMWQQCNEGEL